MQLTVSAHEQARRIVNPDRREFHKLSDLETLHALKNYNSDQVEQPPVDLSIDTDHSSPDQSARTITTAFDLRPEAPTERYEKP